MTAYRANYKLVNVQRPHEVAIPDDAIGITVTPTQDGLSTLIVAWLEPARSDQGSEG